jgi:hypothetical protein
MIKFTKHFLKKLEDLSAEEDIDNKQTEETKI